MTLGQPKFYKVFLYFAGSARTQGYYKLTHNDKAMYLRHARGVNKDDTAESESQLVCIFHHVKYSILLYHREINKQIF